MINSKIYLNFLLYDIFTLLVVKHTEVVIVFMPKVHSNDDIAVFIQYRIQLLMEILIHPPSSQGRCHSRRDMSGHYNLLLEEKLKLICRIFDFMHYNTFDWV